MYVTIWSIVILTETVNWRVAVHVKNKGFDNVGSKAFIIFLLVKQSNLTNLNLPVVVVLGVE